MTISVFYVSAQIPNIEYFEVCGGLQALGGISFLFLVKFHVECHQNHVWGPLGARVMTNFVKHMVSQRSERSRGDPLSSDPLISDPLSSDPLSSDPLSSDPLSSDPLSSDPLSSDPLISDPPSSDPLSSDIETILFRAGTKTVQKQYISTKALQKQYKNATKTLQKHT